MNLRPDTIEHLRRWVKFMTLAHHVGNSHFDGPHMEGCPGLVEHENLQACPCLCHQSFILCSEAICHAGKHLLSQLVGRV